MLQLPRLGRRPRRWLGLGPGSRYLFTPEAVRRLAANRDQVVKVDPLAPPGAGIAAMWQTVRPASPSAATSLSAPSGGAGAGQGRAAPGSAASTH